MKRFLQILAAVAAACSAVAGLDLAGVIELLPEKIAPVVAVGPAIAASLFHFVVALGDVLDDGEKNDSFGKLKAVLLPLAVGSLLCLPSCSVVHSVATGQPIPSTTVQRAGQPEAQPIEIASVELAQAEAAAEAADLTNSPRPVNGLYDAGRAAQVAREVFTELSK